MQLLFFILHTFMNLNLFEIGMFTIKSMDTHHEVYPILKLSVVFLGREVWMDGGEARQVAVESATEHQLPQQGFLCLIEALKHK